MVLLLVVGKPFRPALVGAVRRYKAFDAHLFQKIIVLPPTLPLSLQALKIYF
jgi:hypothetical protein